MGVLISQSDFIHKWAIPQSGYDDLNYIITDKEEIYLTELLGAKLYADFKSKLPVNSLPDNYKFIYNSFSEDFNCGLIISKGMKIMLLNFIWFETMRMIKFKATNEGIVVNSPDSSKSVTTGNLFSYYNDGVETYNAIQFYVTQISPSDFTIPFNGVKKQLAIPTFG